MLTNDVRRQTQAIIGKKARIKPQTYTKLATNQLDAISMLKKGMQRQPVKSRVKVIY